MGIHGHVTGAGAADDVDIATAAAMRKVGSNMLAFVVYYSPCAGYQPLALYSFLAYDQCMYV
jgi:hypothetical protein